MKRARIALLVAAALLLVAALALAWLLYTGPGLRFAVARAERAVPGLAIGAATGSLGSGARFERLRYDGDGVHVRVAKLGVALRFAPLLTGRIALATADADDVHVALEAPAPDGATAETDPAPPSLPRLSIDRGSVRGLRIDRTGAEPMAWTSLDAAVTLGGSRIAVDRLRLAHADYALNGGIVLDLADAWLIERADLALAGTDAAGDPLQATLSRRPRAPIEIKLAQPLQAVLELAPATGAGDFRAKLSIPMQDATRLGLPADLPLLAELELGRSAGDIGVGGVVELGSHRARIGDARLRWGDDGLAIDALPIAIEGVGAIDVRGTLPISAEHTIAIEVASESLEFASAGRPPVHVAGTLAIGGTWSALTIAPDIAVTQEGLPPGAVTGTVAIGPEAIAFDALRLALPRGALLIDGALARGDDAIAELTIDMDRFDPSMFASDWPGALDGSAHWSGGWRGGGITGMLRIAGIDGTLRGQPFALAGTLRVEANALRDADLEGGLGSAQLKIDGDIAGPGALTIAADAPELAILHPSAQGRLRVTAARDSEWRIDAEAETLRWDEIAAEALSLRGSVGVGDDPEIDLQANLRGLVSGELQIQAINAALVGRPGAHALRADVGSERGRVELAANGSWSQRRWDGVVEQFDLALPADRHLRLRQPVALLFDGTRVELGEACWTGPEHAQLCVQGDYGGGDGRAALAVNALPLAWLASLAEDSGLAIENGVLDGHAQAEWKGGALATASVDLASAEGRLLMRERPDLLLGYRGLDIDARFDGNTGTATAATDLLPDGRIDARFDLTRDADGALGYDGNVTLLIRQLDAIEAFTTEVAHPIGRINGQFRLQRDAAGFRAGGAVALSEFNAEIPSLGLALKNGSMALAGVPEGLILRGAVQSGDGTLTVDGRWIDDGEKLALTIKGENVRFSNTPELSVTATPDLQLLRDGKGWNLTGTVDIPRARIQADQISGNATQSPDVVIVDDPPDATPSERWRARVDVRMGDDVQLNGFGFDGKLRGQLAIRQSSGRSATATGQLAVSGLYDAYGQKLTVTRGELLYAGSPLDEPTVAVRAERRIGEATAGIEITGTTRRLISRVYARPAVSESEALALLITGRRLRDVRGSDADRLSGAALALGTIGGDMLAKNLGLDELGVSSNSGLQGEAFTVGKYLSPRLYVGYGIGLLTRGEVFTVRYLVNDRVDVEANVGERQRAAINYRIER